MLCASRASYSDSISMNKWESSWYERVHVFMRGIIMARWDHKLRFWRDSRRLTQHRDSLRSFLVLPWCKKTGFPRASLYFPPHVREWPNVLLDQTIRASSPRTRVYWRTDNSLYPALSRGGSGHRGRGRREWLRHADASDLLISIEESNIFILTHDRLSVSLTTLYIVYGRN